MNELRQPRMRRPDLRHGKLPRQLVVEAAGLAEPRPPARFPPLAPLALLAPLAPLSSPKQL